MLSGSPFYKPECKRNSTVSQIPSSSGPSSHFTAGLCYSADLIGAVDRTIELRMRNAVQRVQRCYQGLKNEEVYSLDMDVSRLAPIQPVVDAACRTCVVNGGEKKKLRT